MVDYGGDAAVRVDFEEGWCLLFGGGEVDVGGFVGDVEFFEEDGDFLPVGGRGGEELDGGCHFEIGVR